MSTWRPPEKRRCTGTTTQKRTCTQPAFVESGRMRVLSWYDFLGVDWATRYPSADTRCFRHMPTDEAAQVVADEEGLQRLTERVQAEAEPACWSWPITDELREALADPDRLRLAFALGAWDQDRCHLCGRHCMNPVEDHDHATMKTRGWICASCNTKEGRNSDAGGMWEKWRERPMTALLGLDWIYDAGPKPDGHVYDSVRNNAMRNVGM